MGKLKKGGEDTRGLKAKQQKAQARQAKESAREAEKQAKEDAAWEEGSNQRAQKKAQEAAEKERKRLETLAAKKAAAEGDEVELAQMRQSRKAKKAQKGKKKKNDLSMLDEYLKEESKSKAKKKQPSNVTEQLPLQKNVNRQRAEEEAQGVFSATGIDNALAAVDLSSKSGNEAVDKHPERRMKAKFKEYEEHALPRLKEEYPGLKLSQLKDKLWKEWQKSPENPMNQVQ